MPRALRGRTLGESAIRARSGLNVVAVEKPDGPAENPTSATELAPGLELVMLGSADQLAAFHMPFT